MKRIDSLTDEQRARFPEWRDKWIAKGLQTGDAHWDTFYEAIKVAYAKANIPFPDKIVRVQSPLVGALAASKAQAILSSDAVDVAVRNAVRGAVDVAVGGAVGDAVGVAVGDAVRGAVDDAVDVAVDDAVDVAVRGAV